RLTVFRFSSWAMRSFAESRSDLVLIPQTSRPAAITTSTALTQIQGLRDFPALVAAPPPTGGSDADMAQSCTAYRTQTPSCPHERTRGERNRPNSALVELLGLRCGFSRSVGKWPSRALPEQV